MELSSKEKAKIDKIKKILVGFNPGKRVIVARNNTGTRGMEGILIEYEIGHRGWRVRLDVGRTQFYYQKNLDLI